MPAIVAMVKEEQAVGDFQPKLMTRSDSEGGSNGARRKSSARTNALYEHGKAKGHERSSNSFSPYAEVSDPSELTFAPKIKGSKKHNDSKGSGAKRIDRLYQAGCVRYLLA